MSVVAVGAEVIVNTVIGGNQYRPFLTSLANGGYMIGWQDASGEGSPPGDISDDVRFAVYDAFGTRVSGAGDLIANTEKKGAQFEGAGSGFSDGKYVMVWTDASQTSPDFNNRAVRGQIFNADGSKSGSPFIVNQSFELSQTEPSVAVLSNGKFVVTWTNEDVDASGAKQILARLFEANGTPAGDEFLINTQQDAGDQNHSTVIGLSGGGFAVVWNDREDSNATNNQTATYIRLYNNAGSALGPAKVANSNAGDPQNISVTEMIDGRLLLVWSDEVFTSPPGDGSGASIRARFLDPASGTFSAKFNVNTSTLNDQTDPQVAALKDGQFVVVWTDRSKAGGDTSFTAVRMQVFDTAGTKVGSEMLVNTETTFEQENPVVTVLADGRFVVAWQDNSHTGADNDSFSVRSRIFDARIAAIDLDGTAGADSYQGTGFGDTINGLAGNDVIKAAAGNDFIFGGLGIDLLFGASGNDKLNGGDDNDELDGGAGKDQLDGGKGADKMTGGKGDDTYFVDNAGDTVIEKPNEGTDTVRTTLISYVLPDNVENLTYDGTLKISAKGNALDNVLKGGAGNDVFLADGGGADTFIGGGGDDTMDFRLSGSGATIDLKTGATAGAAAGDSFQSIETFFGSDTAADTLTGAGKAVTFYGGGGNDQLTGSTAADLLSGGLGNDTITGRAGADTVWGGRGNDTLTGGADADTFWFTDTTAVGGFGTDTITDFEDGSDKIKFALAVATSIADMTIAGNGTTQVTITMAEGTIIVKSAAALSITAADLIFA
jgi:Ca2+-binding RTX toxin-like protein